MSPWQRAAGHRLALILHGAQNTGFWPRISFLTGDTPAWTVGAAVCSPYTACLVPDCVGGLERQDSTVARIAATTLPTLEHTILCHVPCRMLSGVPGL